MFEGVRDYKTFGNHCFSACLNQSNAVTFVGRSERVHTSGRRDYWDVAKDTLLKKCPQGATVTGQSCSICFKNNNNESPLLNRTVVGYKHTWLLGNRYNIHMSYKVFCGWDFCIQDPEVADLKLSFIRNELKVRRGSLSALFN